MKVKIARIGKPHGVRGEVTAQLFTDQPEQRFSKGTVIETSKDSTLTVKGHRWNKDRILLSFEEINNRNQAEEMRNILLFAEAVAAEANDDAWYPHEIEGLDVEYQGKKIGTVQHMEVREAQDLLTIELEDHREALVPFVEEIVPVVDIEQGKIEITPPQGLLDEN
ncbi:MAG: ribosome maturation factor RimM [Micrococcaceae bacterium]